MAMDEAWVFEHSVTCPVPRPLAWSFWTSVPNWRLDADVESVELDGPFATGARGVTISRSSGRLEWRIVEVEPDVGAVIEMPLPGAILRFRWTFEDAAGGGSRITQRVSLAGEQALPLVSVAASTFENGIPAGMQKLCAAMAAAPAPAQPAPG